MYTRLTDEDFKYVFERVPRLCVDIVVRSQDGILLSVRDIEPGKGLWHIPGGTVGKGETLEQAVERIARSETGLTVSIEKQLGTIEFMHEDQGDWERHSVSIVFLVKIMSGELKEDFQSKELQFHQSIPEKMYPGQGEFLREHHFALFTV